MCSRYSLTSPAEAVRAYFGTRPIEPYPPRYNIAPTQPVGIVHAREGDPRGEREFVLVRWGLIPGWVKDPSAFTTLINARAETAADKPSFRAAFRHRRCLVPADGFYEWTGPAGAKRPHLMRSRANGPMAFAGLYESWLGADGSEIDTMAILTVAANATVGAVHDRMPAILQPGDFADWLDCRGIDARAASGMLKPAAEDLLEIIEVDPKLNNPRNEGAQLQRPAGQSSIL